MGGGGFGSSSGGGFGSSGGGGFGSSGGGGFGSSGGGGFGSSGGGGFGSSGGGGFGSSGGGGLGGSSGTFSGPSSIINSSTTGASPITTLGSQTTASSAISTANPFRSTYGNPFSGGLPNANGRLTFGQALYNTGTSGSGGAGALAGLGAPGLGTAGITTGGLGGGLGAQGVGNASVPYASSVGIRRAPAYITVLGPDFAPPQRSATAVVGDLQQSLDRSARLAPGSVTVRMDQGTAVLSGVVSDARQRRLAEGLVRLTPGVHDVRNDVEVRETAPAPRPLP
jgi:hypothetical protein